MVSRLSGMEGVSVPAWTQSVDGIADWRAGELIPAAARPKGAPAPPGRTTSIHSRLLYDVLGAVYDWLGFDEVDDGVFRDLVIARIVEPPRPHRRAEWLSARHRWAACSGVGGQYPEGQKLRRTCLRGRGLG